MYSGGMLGEDKTNKNMDKGLKEFLKAIRHSDKDKKMEVKTAKLYSHYRAFCEKKGIEPLDEIGFFDELAAACPNLNLDKESYTLDELQAIILIDQHENPNLSKLVSILKPQKITYIPTPGPNLDAVFLGFYKWLSEREWPADKKVKGSELYKLYNEFCTEYQYSIRFTPDEFWRRTKEEFPELDYKNEYAFDEVRSIIVANSNIAPF